MMPKKSCSKGAVTNTGRANPEMAKPSTKKGAARPLPIAPASPSAVPIRIAASIAFAPSEAEIGRALEVKPELVDERQVEPVDAAQVLGRLWIKRALGIKRPARRKPHQKERERHDDKKGWQSRGEPLSKESEHGSIW